ncbi:uncharacterized protein I303_105403 [Kwoniella dejecticola CBS 10117]|uniref:Rad60/SUMO-like domain-containing protein n=1 Tax=Kwoniella dejecticola CBS 10117 TaxID=1296121 RepID=A0A1A6A2L6_9TREE|nr:uncharacterized protein I303_05151 [Kwoniella dejecticola CBS 10117]OBR84294.1 hypothetical protein I303_05151 [Kwoniella dejecticola CBS 10117]
MEVEGLKEEKKLVIEIKPTDNAPTIPFKVKRDTPFIKIFRAYEAKLGVAKNTYRFHYDGTRIPDDPQHTPKTLEMKIGKKYDIEAFNEQLGG